MKPSCRLVALCYLSLSGGACVQLGPTVAPPASFNYNEAMAQSLNEQLLPDLV